MAKLAIKKASTDVTVYVFIQTSAGAGLTDLVYNSTGLICYYVRPLGSATALTLATQTVTGAHSDGGFVEVSKTYMPGLYRLDLSDAICATGVNSVVVMLTGFSGMLPVALEIQLTDFDLNTALVTLASTQNAITWGQQKIVANVSGEGALDITNSHAIGGGLKATGGLAGQWNSGTESNGIGQYNNGAYGQKNLGSIIGEYNLGNGAIGQKNQGLTGQLNYGSGSTEAYGQVNDAYCSASGEEDAAQPIGQVNSASAPMAGIPSPLEVLGYDARIASASALSTIDGKIDTIDGIVDDILADTGTDGVVLKAAGLATDAVAEIASVVWGDTLSNYNGVDEAGGEIATAIGNVAAIKAKTDQLAFTIANQVDANALSGGVDAAGVRTAIGLAAANLDAQLSGMALEATLTAMKGAGWTTQTLKDIGDKATDINSVVQDIYTDTGTLVSDIQNGGRVDLLIDAIKAKTDNLPSDPADQSILAGAIAALPLASDYTPARAAKLDYLDAAISSRSTSGEGTISWDYYVYASDGVTPIPYVTVWATSDAGGTAIEASGQTDAAGQVTFQLNAGTYYVWRKKRGYRFSNPDVEVVV